MVNKAKYLTKQAGIVVSLFCFTLIYSCNNGDKVLAQVDEVVLLESEALILMHHLGYDVKSNKAKEQFVKQWVEQETLRLELINTNPTRSKLVEMRAQAFAGELSKYYLEDNYFERKLTEEEIEEFESKKASLKFNI